MNSPRASLNGGGLSVSLLLKVLGEGRDDHDKREPLKGLIE